MSSKNHQCEEMNLAIRELGDEEKLEVSEIDGIPNLEVIKVIYDSSYGEQDEYVFVPIRFCPFCGMKLAKST